MIRRAAACVWLVALVFLVACRGVAPVKEEPAGPVVPRVQHDPAKSYFVKSWLICGPFPYAHTDKPGVDANKELPGFYADHLAAAGGEADACPAIGMRHPGLNGEIAYWRRIDLNGNIIDFNRYFRPTGNRTAYAYCEIESEQDCSAVIGFGSDDSGAFFVNGQLAHRFHGTRGVRIDNEFAKIRLRRGVNRILAKIGNRGGGWGFAYRVTSTEQMFADPGRYAAGMALTIDAKDTNKGKLRLRMGDDRFKLLDELPAVAFDVHGVGWFEAQATETVTVEVGGLGSGLHKVIGRTVAPTGEEITHEGWFLVGNAKAYCEALAARVAVNFPPRSAARVAVEGLLRALKKRNPNHRYFGPGVQIVLQMLMDAEAGRDALKHKTGPCLGGYWSQIDGTPRWYPFYVPKSYDPEKPAPLLVLLHGYDVGNKGLMDGYWENAFRPPGISEAEGVIVVFGFGRGNTDYWGIGRDDVLRAIEGIERDYNVDPNRIYMAGGSMGGTGTWNIGVANADRFAALAPDFGRADFRCWLAPEVLDALRPDQIFREERWAPTYSMDNLLHVPCVVNHGENDPIVIVGHSRAAVGWIKRIGGKVEYHEHKGRGHGGLGNAGASRRWMLNFQRDPHPRRVRLRSGWLKKASLYWVTVDRFEDIMKFAQVDVEITGKSKIRLDTENVAALTLCPPRELIKLMAPLTLEWNGKTYPIQAAGQVKARRGSRSGKPIFVKLSDQTLTLMTQPILPGLRKSARMEGPMSDVTCTPFVFVRGTISQDPFTREVVSREVDKMANDWEMWQHARPRVMDDVDVTDEHIEQLSLILVGGPEMNALTKRVMGPGRGFPLRIEGNTLSLGDATFHGDDLGIAMCYPNPLNPRRYVLLIAGTSWKGIYQLDAFTNKDYDYYLSDHLSQCHPPYDDVVLLKGYFNGRWQFDRRYAWQRPAERADQIEPRRYPKYLRAQDCPDRVVYLSDVVPILAKGDFSRASHDLNWYQQPLRLEWVTFNKGLSTDVEIGIWRNDIFFELDGEFDRFKATVGIEILPDTELTDLQYRNTGIVFYVLGDGRQLYKSRPIGPSDPPLDIDVNVWGVKELWLKSFNKGAWHVKVDSVNWGAPRVVRRE